MGLFDMVYAPCAHCGAGIEYQSKADDAPYMNSYTLETAPTHILVDVLNDPHYCAQCGNWTALYDARYPPERPRPSPIPRKLRQPTDGEWHGHSTHTDLRWWDAPFSEDDFADTPAQGGG